MSSLDSDVYEGTKGITEHKRRDAAEIRLHFINLIYQKYAYRHSGIKLARRLVAYL